MDLLEEYSELIQDDGTRYARDIYDCDECPIFHKDCPGGCTGTPNGYREPPCASWNEDTLVYEGMYSDYD